MSPIGRPISLAITFTIRRADDVNRRAHRSASTATIGASRLSRRFSSSWLTVTREADATLSAATPSPTIALATRLGPPAKRWVDADDGSRLLDIVSASVRATSAIIHHSQHQVALRCHRDLSARHGQWSGMDADTVALRHIFNERRTVHRVVMLVPLLPVTTAWCAGLRCRSTRSHRSHAARQHAGSRQGWRRAAPNWSTSPPTSAT
jgi:hypothetical protein